MRPQLRIAAAVLVMAAWLAGPNADPADAHASARLPHASLEADGTELRVTWTADPDDAADVGVALGLLPEEVVWTILDGGSFGDELLAQLQAAFRDPALEGYLLEHIQVRQDGERCPGEVVALDDFVFTGATVAFTCPEPVAEIDLRITMLHDRDPAYRTFGVDGTEGFSLHTAAAPEHRWDLSGGTTPDGRAEPVIIVGLAVTVLAAGLLVLRAWPRARRRGGGAG